MSGFNMFSPHRNIATVPEVPVAETETDEEFNLLPPQTVQESDFFTLAGEDATNTDNGEDDDTEEEDFEEEFGPDDEDEPSLLDLEFQEQEEAEVADAAVKAHRVTRTPQKAHGVSVTLDPSGTLHIRQGETVIFLDDFESALFIMGRLGAGVAEILTAKAEVRKINPANINS